MATVEEILMTKGPDVIVASPQTTALEAAKLMSQANVGSVIIKDEEEVRGIFTERDLLQRVVAMRKDPDATLLSEVMTSPVKSCSLTAELDDVVGLLTTKHMRHLAIVEDNALIGLIGLRDVMAADLRVKESKIRDLEEQLV